MVAVKQYPHQLKPFMFKKGQSGNPKGRKKGKTLKDFARQLIQTLSDDEKIAYLNSLDREIVWKMAEGNPHQSTDAEVKGVLQIIFDSSFNKDEKLATTQISNPYGLETI